MSVKHAALDALARRERGDVEFEVRKSLLTSRLVKRCSSCQSYIITKMSTSCAALEQLQSSSPQNALETSIWTDRASGGTRGKLTDPGGFRQHVVKRQDCHLLVLLFLQHPEDGKVYPTRSLMTLF